MKRPERVLFVTITDGEHNSNLDTINGKGLKWNGPFPQFTADQVKNMIEHQTQVYNWDFAYIGANQDAWAVGGSIGVSKGSSLNYAADSDGVALAFASLGSSTQTYRSAGDGKRFAFTPTEKDTV